MRIPHELGDEFPDQASLIGRLTKTNYEFGRLAAAYDEVNRQIWRIESEDAPTADEVARRAEEAASYSRMTLKHCSPSSSDECRIAQGFCPCSKWLSAVASALPWFRRFRANQQ